MNTIADKWESFKKDVIANDAPDAQYKEMRLAFFGGAQAILSLQLAITHQSVSEDAGVAIIEGWHDEIRLFIEEINKDK